MNPNFAEIIKSDARILALRDFIFDVYPKRREQYPFCTSFTTYAITCTDEEMLVDEAIQAITSEEYPDYIKLIPMLVNAIALEHATKLSQADAAIVFTQDFVRDYVLCMLRETKELEDA